MIYQDYFRNSDFEDIWNVLNGFYMEHESLKPIYSSLVDSIRTMPINSKYSDSTIRMRLDSDDEIMVEGAPDPQEWLLGREVEIDFTSWKDRLIKPSGVKTHEQLSGSDKRRLARNSDTATLAAHLLFWSTLYGVKTQAQNQKEMSEWLDSLEKGIMRFKTGAEEKEGEYLAEGFRRKRRKYWSETIGNDSAYDWTWNLCILRKKLEYNIGYWRYVQRHVGWHEDVQRMQLAIELINIATTQSLIEGKYINLRTAARYTRERNPEAHLNNVYLTNLYHDKAFHILWKWLDHNMKDWWD